MNNTLSASFLHVMIRVSNLEKSVKFYTEVLNMKIRKKEDYPEGKFTLVFLYFENDPSLFEIELTYNWDINKYEMGNGFGHIALKVNDIYKFCEEVKQHGGNVTREPGPMKHGTTLIAFIKDPDGYLIELIQKDKN